MAHTAPLFIPLTKGLDLSKEPVLGGGELHLAHNVDFTVDGQVKGRPARSAPLLFSQRDLTVALPDYGYVADTSFQGTAYEATGLVTVRDAFGERPALACEGRLFTQDGTRWVDRGPMHCARTDELATFQNQLDGTVRGGVAPDFGITDVTLSGGGFGKVTFKLLATNGAPDKFTRLTLTGDPVMAEAANAARCGTTTAMVMPLLTNDLVMFYRVNGSDTLNQVNVANDALATVTDVGDAPVISASHDAAHFFIAYKATAANVVKVLKVSITGTVVATYTSAAIAGLTGIWVDNSSVLKDKVALGFTHTGGFTVRVLNHALVDQAIDTTDITGGMAGLDCVVGCTSDDASLRTPTIWWAYRSADAGLVGDGDIAIGYRSSTLASSTQVAFYYGGGAFQEASVKFGIAHQPVQVNGRMYMTLTAAANRNETGTWTSIGLESDGTITPVATGPVEHTIPYLAPSGAVVNTEGNGWTWGALNWSRFATDPAMTTTGYDAYSVMNRVTLSQPRTAHWGETTVFSGSVPYMLTKTQLVDVGFPFLGGLPAITAYDVVGGAVPLGRTYSAAACWKWTDDAGQIHRSALSRVVEGITNAAAFTIRAVVTNPWITAKNVNDLRLEVYTTGYDAGGTPTTTLKLQDTVAITWNAAYTTVDITAEPATDTETVYTDGGVFSNYHVPADGGVTAVGRRLWMAGPRSVYASKLLVPGEGPGFNDEGPLQVNLPAGAGRIIALEELDDKVLIFCERGVYATNGNGPSNTGSGDDFAYPFKLAAQRLAGPRSAMWCVGQGVLFVATPDATEPSRGGIWLINRQLELTTRNFIGKCVQTYFDDADWVPDVTYCPERQQAYVSADTGTIVVADFGAEAFATWGHPGSSLSSITCSGGVLWAMGDEPVAYSGAPGTDADEGDYTMQIRTAHLPADGKSALGWSRVRALTVLAGVGSGAHDLTTAVVQDTTRTTTNSPVSLTAAGADTTWPASWQTPEWRLPVQKCSTIRVDLSASPANAKWAAIRLDVAPMPSLAPPRTRT